ncbi:MAG: hypothetical protein AAF639_12105 [Chloroflexota bacterium]
MLAVLDTDLQSVGCFNNNATLCSRVNIINGNVIIPRAGFHCWRRLVTKMRQPPLGGHHWSSKAGSSQLSKISSRGSVRCHNPNTRRR